MNQRGFILPSPMMLMAGVIAFLALTNFITYKLWRSEVAEYAQFKADVVTQSEILKAEAERAKAESKRISADAARAWAAARANRRGTIIVRVPTDCNSASLRPVPGSPSGTDAATAQSGLGADRAITAAQCETIANKAVFDAAQVMHLQDWARKQGEVR